VLAAAATGDLILIVPGAVLIALGGALGYWFKSRKGP
jgi:hypothetical protein